MECQRSTRIDRGVSGQNQVRTPALQELKGPYLGATKNARPDITRLDNAAPYRKGGHRETCFSVRVDAHYKFMFDSGSII